MTPQQSWYHNSWFLLASSAFGYGLALIMPSYFWPLTFVCFVPLFYLGSQRGLSYKQGFFYGALLWGIGGFGILQSLFSMSSGSLVLRLVAPIAIVLIQAFVAGFWFLGTSAILSLLAPTNQKVRLATLIITTWLYFYWVINLSLSMFNYWEGYFLMYPLLPLAHFPQLLSWMPILGKGALMMLLLITNAGVALRYTSKSSYRILFALIGLLPWIASVVTAPAQKKPPTWLSSVACIPKEYPLNTDLSYTARIIKKDLRELLSIYPEVQLVLFPESSLIRLNLATAHELGTYWNSASLGKPISLIIGAFKWEGPQYHNTIYWLYDGILKGSFNKRHAMALTEEIKGWYNFSFLRQLFYGSSPIIAASDNKRIPFPIFKEISFIPYICSEIFFNDVPDDHYPKAVITALCNDTWSSSSYIRRLMFLAARFKAIEWQRPILYAAYHYSGYCDTDGTVTSLKQLDQGHRVE